ncbi:large ribosomal subunit protein uL4m-like [Tubulanus polymorphus]|uniref:large ribosomal subunit protein uL4m-like n=1 Tax=Tubulanus polymorphus TaxID=672921 RepID=UPI003DA6927E
MAINLFGARVSHLISLFRVATPVTQCFTRITKKLHTSGIRQSTEELIRSPTSLDGSPLSKLQLPVITSRKLEFPNKYRESRQAWLETLATPENEMLGIVDLHPDIFAAPPRIDMIWENVRWQNLYRNIVYNCPKNRAEMRGSNRKPWPQKGTGRARHGSRRSPLWFKGGIAKGPRGPFSRYYMLNVNTRIKGLCSALTFKYAQDDLHIVDSLDLPSENPEYLEELMDAKNWGLSVLFIDDTDIMPRNIIAASSKLPQFNLMPVYGLNIVSMLKHEGLVITLRGLEKLEKRLLHHMNAPDEPMNKHQFTVIKEIGDLTIPFTPR